MKPRTHRVSPEEAGETLSGLVRSICGLSWRKARTLCRSGQVSLDGRVVSDPVVRPPPGAEISVVLHKPPIGPKIGSQVIVHADREVVVVDKPAGIVTVPFGDARGGSLVQRVSVLLRRIEGRTSPPLRVVQRLDKDTTGVLVFARTRQAERFLQDQLRRHVMDRLYLALALGRVSAGRHDTLLVPDRGDHLRGSLRGHPRRPPPEARRAITEIEPLEGFTVPEGLTEGSAPLQVTLVACRLQTGRQHQIRIHTSEAGHPLVGESVYVREYRGSFVRGFSPGHGRPLLHAARLAFVHPASERTMTFERPVPPDFETLLERLRRS